MNPEAFAASIRDYIDSAVDLAVAEAVKDLKGEKGEPGRDGVDGKDGNDAVVRTEDIEACVQKALPSLVSVAVDEAVKTLPPAPKGDPGRDGADGKDGADGRDGKDGADGVDGKEGVGISALDVKDGNLIVTLTNGNEKALGRIVGRDGADGRDGKDGAPGNRGERGEKGDMGPVGERGERGEKGADGITEGHLNLILDHKIAELAKSVKLTDDFTLLLGDRPLGALPVFVDRGVWSDSIDDYRRGNAVSYGGSLWICQKDATKSKPGAPPNADWRLAVKKGRDGKDRTKE